MTPPRRLRIHFLVSDTNGAIHSAPGGTTFFVGAQSRWRCACDAAVLMGQADRGTTEPWGVRCTACKATDEFRAANRPRPPMLTQGDPALDESEP